MIVNTYQFFQKWVLRNGVDYMIERHSFLYSVVSCSVFKLSKWLSSMLPTFETKCDVYVIEVKLVKPISEESNPKRRRIINPFETDLAFGFLAKDTIPTVSYGLLFTNNGNSYFISL